MYVENSYLSKQLCFLFYVSSKEIIKKYTNYLKEYDFCLLYTSPSPRDMRRSRMPSSA
ncbi:hypothetical protein JMUB7528_28580 [Staphylococcus aureus]